MLFNYTLKNKSSFITLNCRFKYNFVYLKFWNEHQLIIKSNISQIEIIFVFKKIFNYFVYFWNETINSSNFAINFSIIYLFTIAYFSIQY